MVSFRNARKLSSNSVRAKLYPLERRVGSCKCSCNHCQVCRSITENDILLCNNDQKSYKFNHRFDCNEKCLIYLLTCCQKQNVGQTVNIFRNRWNNYKEMLERLTEGNTECKGIYLYEHFILPGH